MHAWKCLLLVALVLLLALGVLLPGTVNGQGEIIRPKPRPNEGEGAPELPSGTDAAGVAVPVGEVTIGFMPFFSADECFDDAAERSLDRWLKQAVKSLLKEEPFREVERQWIRSKAVRGEIYELLPSSRTRDAAELLRPLAKKGIEGVIATWVEDKGDSYDLVVVLYLPNRLRFEGYRLSANFERSTLIELPEGGIAEDPTRALMKDLVRRNLNRILPAEPESNPAGQAVSSHEPTDGGQDAVDHRQDEPRTEDRPANFAVFDFSTELSGSSHVLEAEYLRALQRYEFGSEALAVLRRLVGDEQAVRARDPRPITYDQVEAPVIDLDPDADPKARERALFARAGPDVDALVFGHLKPVTDGSSTTVRLWIRLLTKPRFDIVRSYRDLGGQARPESWARDVLEVTLRDLLAESALLSSGSAEGFEIVVQPGESASEIAERCFDGGFSMELVYDLCAANGFYSRTACDRIREGTHLRIPRRLGIRQRNDSACEGAGSTW